MINKGDNYLEKHREIEERHLLDILSDLSGGAVATLEVSGKSYELMVELGGISYRLHSQRGGPRFFKTSSTAIAFVVKLGFDTVKIDNLSKWEPDTYVSNNSRRRS